MGALRFILVALAALTAVLSTTPALSEEYEDDEFWRDAPPKAQPKEKIDPKTGQRLVATTIRFYQARLRPDRTRSPAIATQLASDLNEIFVQEGMSHNRASAQSTHVLTIQTRDDWEELKDAVFSLSPVYDVIVKEQVHVRPGETKPYAELWRAEMGEGIPVPLAPNSAPLPSAAPAAARERKKSKEKKKKKKSKEKKEGSGAGSTTEL